MTTLVGDHLLTMKYRFLVGKGRIRSLNHSSQEVDEGARSLWKYEVIPGPTLIIGIFRQSRNVFPFGFGALMKQGI